MNSFNDVLNKLANKSKMAKEDVLLNVVCSIIHSELRDGKIPTVIFINKMHKDELIKHCNNSILRINFDDRFYLYNLRVRWFDGVEDEDYYIGYNVYEMAIILKEAE